MRGCLHFIQNQKAEWIGSGSGLNTLKPPPPTSTARLHLWKVLHSSKTVSPVRDQLFKPLSLWEHFTFKPQQMVNSVSTQSLRPLGCKAEKTLVRSTSHSLRSGGYPMTQKWPHIQRALSWVLPSSLAFFLWCKQHHFGKLLQDRSSIDSGWLPLPRPGLLSWLERVLLGLMLMWLELDVVHIQTPSPTGPASKGRKELSASYEEFKILHGESSVRCKASLLFLLPFEDESFFCPFGGTPS